MNRLVLGAVVGLSLFGAAGLAQASSLTSPQLSAIIGLLQAFGANQDTVANVAIALGGTSTAAAIGATPDPITILPFFTATCTVSPTTTPTGSSATWTATPTGGVPPYTYVWTGTGYLSGKTASVTKTYPVAGTKVASVTVTDKTGVKYTPICPNLTIVAPPPLTATCTVSPASITTGGSATWTATPTGGVAPYTYYWSGTGSLTGTTASVTKTYTAAGNKIASVAVTDNAGTTYTPICPNLTVSGTTGALMISPLLSTQATFPDPFPIIDPTNASNWNKVGTNFVFFSTQDKMLSFPSLSTTTPPQVHIQTATIDLSLLQNTLNPNFSINNTLWSKNVFFDQATCRWHMIASVYVVENDWQDGADNIWPQQSQTVIVHASPNYTTCTTAQAAWSHISSWKVDKQLVGHVPTVNNTSFSYANYVGKLMQDAPGDPLYLVYVARLANNVNGLVAQRMVDPKTVATSTAPITLLAPSPDLNSEYRDGTQGLQLTETGNIVKINHTWVLLYTVGDYQTNDYKIGVAYSDSMTGPYQKVIAPDTNNVWGENAAGVHNEVVYLLQSQKPAWFNYTQQVTAPGVPSIISQTVNGASTYFLTFAGYPSTATIGADGKYNPAQRIPYYAPLTISIPTSAGAVAGSQPSDRTSWIKVQ